MHIIAIPATNSRGGLNHQLVAYAARLLAGDLGLGPEAATTVEVETVDLNDYEMPIYSTERERTSGVPDAARRLFDKIGAADAVIVSFAEYNGSYTAAWKNVHDWMSRIDMAIYQGKRVAMFAATPGPRGGAGVLGSATPTAPFFGAELVGSLGIPSFGTNFDADRGEITDPDLRARFTEILAALTTLTAPLPGR